MSIIALPPAISDGAAALSASAETMAKSASDNCNVAGTLASFTDGATGELVKAMEEASNAVLEATAGIAKAVNEAISGISTVLASINEKITLITTQIAAAIADGLTGFAAILTEALGSVTDAANSALSAVGDAISDAASVVGDAVAAVTSALDDVAGTLGDVVQKVGQLACGGVTAALGAVGAGISPDLDAIAGPVAAAAPPSRGFQPGGNIVNFNIDKTLPYADVTLNGQTVRLYGTEAQIIGEYPDATIVQPEDADDLEELDSSALISGAASAPTAATASAASSAASNAVGSVKAAAAATELASASSQTDLNNAAAIEIPGQYPFIHPDDSSFNIHTFDTGDRRVDYVDRFARPFQLPASEGDFVNTRTNDQGGQIIIYVYQETDQIWFPYTIAMYEAESGESVPFSNLDNIVRQPV